MIITETIFVLPSWQEGSQIARAPAREKKQKGKHLSKFSLRRQKQKIALIKILTMEPKAKIKMH